MNKLNVSNVTERSGVFEIEVMRRGQKKRACVPKTFPGGRARRLAEAVRVRDNMLATAGPIDWNHRPLSNTGILGITETTLWARNYAYPVFSVHWSKAGKNFGRQIIYGTNGVTREAALEQAKALRKKMAGELVINPTVANLTMEAA